MIALDKENNLAAAGETAFVKSALAQVGAREDAAGLAHEYFQQRHLAGGKLDVTVAAMHLLVRQIQRQIVYPQRDLRLFRVTPPERADARHQFLHRKWFREIIVS